jgi:hypothetical protein
VKGKFVCRLYALAVEAHEQRSGAGSVETFIVIENLAFQFGSPLFRRAFKRCEASSLAQVDE